MPVDEATLEDRRKAKLVLKHLREHQTQVEEDKDDAVNCGSNALGEHLQKAQENAVKSKTVEQALLDAQIFRQLAECTVRQAEQLQSGLRTYDIKSFVDCMLKSMGNDSDTGNGVIDIVKLGRSVAGNYKTVPSLDFMYGNEPKDTEQKPREKRTAVRQVMKEKDVVKPRELKTDQLEQTETDRQVAMMKKELERRKSSNFWKFVIDPNDFARSVENLFHSSFLIKDGWAQLDLLVTPPTITYRTPDTDVDGQADTGSRAGCSEFIMEFDSVKWQNVIDEHNITRCVFPRDR